MVISGVGVVEALANEMKRVTGANRCTQRTAARLAITNIIRSDVLMPGDLLSSEKELTGILGISLGTVQAAPGQFKLFGVITRRRGEGSRVGDQEPLKETKWHFRFLSKSDMAPGDYGRIFAICLVACYFTIQSMSTGCFFLPASSPISKAPLLSARILSGFAGRSTSHFPSSVVLPMT